MTEAAPRHAMDDDHVFDDALDDTCALDEDEMDHGDDGTRACSLCVDFGEAQCDVHGPATIALMARHSDHAAARSAIRTILSVTTIDGPAWRQLVAAARAADLELEADGP